MLTQLAPANGQVDTAPAPEAPPAPAAAATASALEPSGTPPSVPELLGPYLVTLHRRQFVRYVGLLLLAHERGLVSLKARFVSVTGELATAEAEATFADGRTFCEAADASPTNVGIQVKAHYPRMALTRSSMRYARGIRVHLCRGDCSTIACATRAGRVGQLCGSFQTDRNEG